MKKEWKQPDDDMLRKLWDQGLSAAKIGEAMGLAKNAIVGRAHRLKLTGRKSPIIREPGQRAPYPRERRIRNGQRHTLAVVAPQVATKPVIQAPLPVSAVGPHQTKTDAAHGAEHLRKFAGIQNEAHLAAIRARICILWTPEIVAAHHRLVAEGLSAIKRAAKIGVSYSAYRRAMRAGVFS